MLFVQLPGVGYNWRKEPCGVEAGRACPVEEVEGGPLWLNIASQPPNINPYLSTPTLMDSH